MKGLPLICRKKLKCSGNKKHMGGGGIKDELYVFQPCWILRMGLVKSLKLKTVVVYFELGCQILSCKNFDVPEVQRQSGTVTNLS